MLKHYCVHLYKQEECKPNSSIEIRSKFWVDVNWEILQLAKTLNLNHNQFMMVRIEDLVSGETQCVRDLANFVKSKVKSKLLHEVIAKELKFKSRFFGGKQFDVLDNIPPKLKQGLEFWGYSTSTFNLSLACQNLSWKSIWDVHHHRNKSNKYEN